jgi:hypothetical protein
VLTRRLSCLSLVSMFLFIGCTDQATKDLTKKSKVVSWPELTALKSPEFGMGIFLSAQRGDVKTLKSAVLDPKLEEAIEKLASTKIPPAFASPARDKAKEKAVSAYKFLISKAKGASSPKELKEAAKTVQDAMNELSDPELK